MGWGEILETRGLGLLALYLVAGQIHALVFFRMPVNLRHSPGYPAIPALAILALLFAWPLDLAVRIVLRVRRRKPAQIAAASVRPASLADGSRHGSGRRPNSGRAMSSSE